jgi:transcriptional regulator GlxA family with amidase domain
VENTPVNFIIGSTAVKTNLLPIASALLILALSSPGAFAGQAPGRGSSGDAPAPQPRKAYILEVVVSEKGILLDFAGAAEAFREAADTPFRIYYVAATMRPVTLKGGMRIIPSYTFDDAPQPDYVLLGSQGTMRAPQNVVRWLRSLHVRHTTLVSVCTGSKWLAQTGLLANKEATTHHLTFERFKQTYRAVKLIEGKRYVQSDPYIFTGAGFSSGMDLALHIIDLRFGRDIAKRTADRLEYRGTGWITNDNNYSAGAGK